MELVSRVAGAVLSGLLFSQSAEFTQQYLQRLGGAAGALRAVVERFDESAAAGGLSRQEAVAQLRAAPDRFVSRQGFDAAETIRRFEAVEGRYAALKASAPLFRPFVALSDLDRGIALDAAADYRPALPATLDGLALTLAGFSGGWVLGSAAAAGLRGHRRRKAALVPDPRDT